MNERVEFYLDVAKEEKNSYELLNQVEDKINSVICFGIAQAVENIIKALWNTFYYDKKVCKEHNIGFMMKEINKKYAVPSEMIVWADNLIRYVYDYRCIRVRQVEELELKIAMYKAQKIYDWALKHIEEYSLLE